MRMVSWNMNKRKQGTWEYLRDTLKPDVALLQECSPIVDKSITDKCITVDVNERNKNTIYSESGKLIPYKTKLPNDGGMAFNVALENFDDFGDVYFISVYGNLAFWDEKNIEKNIFDIHIIGALTVYTRTLRAKYNAEHIIIAGDFNIDPRMDSHEKYGREGFNRWSGHFEDICALGFVDCLKLTFPDYVQTHKNNNSDFPWQIDHCFATEELFGRLKHVEVAEEVIERRISDHNPIIADFE